MDSKKIQVIILTFLVLILIISVSNTVMILYLQESPSNANKKSIKEVLTAKNSGAANEASLEEPNKTSDASDQVYNITKTVTIGKTQDSRGLGYSGQKKIIIRGNRLHAAYRKTQDSDANEIYVTSIDSDLDTSTTTTTNISNVGGPNDQRVPSIAGDESNIYVIWYGAEKEDDDKNNRQVKFSRFNNGSWADYKNITYIDGFDGQTHWQEHPDIAVNGTTLFAAWEGKDKVNEEEQQLKFSVSVDNGSTWTEWRKIRESPENTQSRPNVTFVGNDVHLLFYSKYGTKSQKIWHTVSKDLGKSWSEYKQISKGKFDARHATAIEKDGVLYAVWREQNEANATTDIMLAYLENGSWSNPIVVDKSDKYQFFPSIGSTSEKGVFITWVETSDESEFPNDEPETESDGFIIRFDKDSNTFSNKIEIPLEGAIFYPHLSKSDTDSNLYLTYLERNPETTYDLKIARLSP
jgi:hypothetical protein